MQLPQSITTCTEFRLSTKSSMYITKRVGDSVHPCFTPFVTLNQSDSTLFTSTVQFSLLYNAFKFEC